MDVCDLGRMEVILGMLWQISQMGTVFI